MVSITPVLGNHHVRPEFSQKGRNDRIQCAQPLRITGTRGQRTVDRGPFSAGTASVAGPASSRKLRDATFVERDGHHARIVPKNALHSVAVVHVHIDIDDPLCTVG